jgi:hypothetical protein
MGTIAEKIELFDDRLMTETLRQWIVLLVLISLFTLICTSIFTLYKTYRRLFSPDIIMLALIQIRIVLHVLGEFIIPSRFIFYVADVIHLIILCIIFFMFTKILLVGSPRVARCFRFYFIGMSAVIGGLLAVGILKFNNTFPCDNDNPLVGYAIYLMQAVGVLMSSLNLILTCFFINKLKNQESEGLMSPTRNRELSDMLDQSKEIKVKKLQINFLSRGLFLYIIVYSILIVVGDFLVYNRTDFK